MSEIVTAESWLYSKLHGDVTLLSYCTGGIFTWPVPAEYTQPYALFQLQSGIDVNGVGSIRIGINSVWIVRAVFEALSWGGNLNAAADRIDALLHRQASAQGGGYVWACVREEPFRLVEVANGRQFRHLGGVYRMWVQ